MEARVDTMTGIIIAPQQKHIPVMLEEVLTQLNPKTGDRILDGTFGAGGYSRLILERCAGCEVIAIDRDPSVTEFADILSKKYASRFTFHNSKFSEVENFIEKNSLDGIVLDLGVSSMQLDEASRGFSFSKEAKLAMTMGKNDFSAYDVVNSCSEANLISIIGEYGEESRARMIAKRIVSYRKFKPIETTTELASIVHSCFARKQKIDNATKTFQALRIFVNDELNELQKMLRSSISLLRSGGRLVVVTFHSLEDRIVKNFLMDVGDARKSKVNKYKNLTEKAGNAADRVAPGGSGCYDKNYIYSGDFLENLSAESDINGDSRSGDTSDGKYAAVVENIDVNGDYCDSKYNCKNGDYEMGDEAEKPMKKCGEYAAYGEHDEYADGSENCSGKIASGNGANEVSGFPLFRIITKKPLEVSTGEINSNRRSRSAKLRCAVKY